MGRILLLIAGAALLLGLAAGCSSTDTKDLEDQIAALEQQVTTLEGTAQITDMRSALDTLDGAGLHGVDEGANENNEVVAGASGGVGRALMAVASTTWPAELQEGADATQAALEELATALESADPAVVGPPATAAHETAHDFSTDARNHIAEAVGLPVEAHDEGTAVPTGPAADGTAEATP